MPAICWEMLIRTGFESRWGLNFGGSAGGISGHALSLSVLVEGLSEQTTLPLAWHAATDINAKGWGIDCIQFKLSHCGWPQLQRVIV